MTKKNNKSHKKPNNISIDEGVLPKAKRKGNFKTFEDLATYAKSMVYLIVRLRAQDDQTFWLNLGTGFLIGNQRMITCSHCIYDQNDPDSPLSQHKDGDIYLMVQKDEQGNMHRVGVIANENQNLFVYPDIDTAIFHLDDNFYQVDGKYFKHPEMYLELSKEVKNIGAEMGIIGYPFPNLTFNSTGDVDISDVHIRVDKGVINTSYITGPLHVYESTTAFNPGNSGGPILDVKTGKVIGIVKGYTPIPMHWVEDIIPAGANGNIEDAKQRYRLRTIYSFGISSQTLLQLAEKHQLAVG